MLNFHPRIKIKLVPCSLCIKFCKTDQTRATLAEMADAPVVSAAKRWISKIGTVTLGVSSGAIDSAMGSGSSAELLDHFCSAAGASNGVGVRSLLFYKQGSSVIMSKGEGEGITESCLYFVRLVDKPLTATVE